MIITLPIYYDQEFKTKKSKRFMVGMNWYRNAHYVLSNKVKDHYHDLVSDAIQGIKFNKIQVEYKVYVKRMDADGPNVRSVIEKFFLDGLVNAGALPNDSIGYVVGDSSSYFLDKENPRVEIIIKEIE